MFCIRHPQDRNRRASYGYNGEKGFFVTTTHAGTEITYESVAENYDDDEPMLGALVFLAHAGFFTAADLYEALALRRHPVARRLRGGVRRVLRVIQNFELAAG